MLHEPNRQDYIPSSPQVVYDITCHTSYIYTYKGNGMNDNSVQISTCGGVYWIPGRGLMISMDVTMAAYLCVELIHS